MSIYKRKYPTMEVAILCVNYPDADNERVCPGDIIEVRPPSIVIGNSNVERKYLLWLRLEGLEEDTFHFLNCRNYDSKDEYGHGDVQRYDKRRFSIPLKRLKQRCPRLDLNRVKDPNDLYQPFMIIDEEFKINGENHHRFIAPAKALRIEGLVYDKVLGRYL